VQAIVRSTHSLHPWPEEKVGDMKLVLKQGTQGFVLGFIALDSSVTDGSGKTGLVFNSAGLIASYWRQDSGNNDATSITLAAGTRGTYVNSAGAGTGGGFIAKDSTKMPGAYEFSVPNAVLVTGSAWAIIVLRGAVDMADVRIEIQLVSATSQDVLDLLSDPFGGSSHVSIG
jgi:hypothetical protein